MNFSPKVRAWILLVCTALASGGAAASVAKAGGSTTGWSIVSAIVGATTAIIHALMASPSDAPGKSNSP